MKKVLMVHMCMESGGAETHVLSLAKALKNAGWDVVVASNGGIYLKELERSGIRHYKVPVHTKRPVEVIRSLGLLEKIIEAEEPDVVHAHARIPAFICGILHRKMMFPFVTTAHWTFRVTPVLRRITDWGQQVLSVSDDISDYLTDNYMIPSERIHATINGIDTDRFAPKREDSEVRKEFGIPEEAPLITCVTRMFQSPTLHAGLLIDIAESLAGRLPGLRILLVGSGAASPSLEKRAAAVNSTLGYRAVIMTGDRTDIPEILNAGGIFVGVSRAALEAMSCQLPVVLCGSEGFSGLVTRERAEFNKTTNYCCRNCETSTAEALERELLRVFAMPQEDLHRLGAEGRQIVMEQYSLDTMVKDHVKVYDLAIHDCRTIMVSGYYGYHNLGDDAILGTICRDYSQQYNIVALSRLPKETAAKYGTRAIHRFNLLKIRKCLKNCAMLVSGGGSLLQDRTSTRSLLYYLLIIRMAQRKHVPVMVYANGIGPIRSGLNRRLTAKVLNRVTAITLRDQDSAKTLSDMGVVRPITVTADPVFTETPVAPETARAELARIGVPAGKDLIAVSLRRLSSYDVDKMASVCDRIARETGCGILFIIMQTSADTAVSRQVAERMQEQSWIYSADYQPRTMMGVLGETRLVVSMRLHTLIFAAVSGTKILGFNFDPKITTLLKELRAPAPLSMEDSAETLAGRILEGYDSALPDISRMHTLATGTARELHRILASSHAGARRVLHIIGGGDSGGAKTHVLSLLRGLLDEGYQILLVCFLEGDFSRSARELGIPTMVLPQNKLMANYRLLLDHIRTDHPDVIHCHGARANMYGALLRRSAGAPVVTTVHSDPKLDYMGRPLANCTFGVINRAALQRLGHFVCVSDAMKNILASRGFRPEALHVIYNGVNTRDTSCALTRAEFFRAYGMVVEPDSVVFGIAARLSPVKDIGTLIRAFALTVARYPSARLMIAGNGEDEEMLRELAKTLTPEGSVVFLGWLEDTDSFYNALDVNVLTSLSETFPYALSEGGRMRCATLATRVGGIPHMVLDGETGLLFEPGDADTLSGYMNRMIEDPALRKELGEAMYQRVSEHFSLDSTIRTQMRIYESILGKESDTTSSVSENE